ncbi:EAL domain, c-di-GMP-specific phosphodiesterase class I (or its enzymatically inactive variant) [Paracoccus isoporae]|uniref:EAL domain, c-di-GMP-specific phosphodiesterase class I (Or its enzymatically inactive variant) n=1 Tax=Paracoccus isoporae TaxID=591205 RepID=A0A1G7CG05_9RHOB|nr:EAL domain-containing protein [Paracoccus isoporae]SDE37626.1 EAL domain, c-di-GMP-specific phosphodiesterase class I (or its enzymatically inactive variant) [Paracoccus isoporae]
MQDDGQSKGEQAVSALDYVIRKKMQDTMAVVERAAARGDVVLAYQPIVQADRPSRAAFHEGLFRVIDDTGRFVPLRDFMPMAETTELGRRIDCLSLCMGLDALQHDSGMRLSINMSARSIGNPVWMETLRRGLARDEHIAERLVLEVTESSAMDMPELVVPFMRDLQGRGTSFALDDFGAGHTSFRYLREFSFDMIKIDGQFIRKICEQPDNQVLTGALQAIAHHFDMFTVAESVETADDAAYLIEMGIDCLQGFYFGAPTITPPWKSPRAASG